jgi:hypothetical protein
VAISAKKIQFSRPIQHKIFKATPIRRRFSQNADFVGGCDFPISDLADFLILSIPRFWQLPDFPILQFCRFPDFPIPLFFRQNLKALNFGGSENLPTPKNADFADPKLTPLSIKVS